MTRPELITALKELSAARIELADRKNQNYSGDDALANFTRITDLTGGYLTPAQGVFVRLSDKLSRLGNLLFSGQDKVGETLEDTAQDLANYADLMTIILRQPKKL